VFLHPVLPTSTSVVEKNASAEDADVVLWNRASSGHVIATLRASDADEGPNADVEYSLVAGNDDRLFDVDRKRGDVTLGRNLRGDVDDQVRRRTTSNTCHTCAGKACSTTRYNEEPPQTRVTGVLARHARYNEEPP